MQNYLTDYPWLLRLTILLIGFIFGIMIEKFLIKSLKLAANKTKWEWDDIIVAALHWIPFLWCVCLSLYVILYFTKLNFEYKELVENVLSVAVIFSVTVICARFLEGYFKLLATRTHAVQSTTILSRTTNLIIYMIGAFIILQNLNIEITPLLTALGVGGLAVALALQDTLGNLFSGIQIMAIRQVRVRDYIKLASGEEGYVIDIKSRNTVVESFPDNNMIIIPNTTMVSSIVTNYNLPKKRMWVKVSCGVHYDSDLEHVEAIAVQVGKEVLAKIEGEDPVEMPFVRFNEFGDSSINFNVRLFIREFRDFYLIRHTYIKALHQAFRKEGVEIPYPIRTVHMKQVS